MSAVSQRKGGARAGDARTAEDHDNYARGEANSANGRSQAGEAFTVTFLADKYAETMRTEDLTLEALRALIVKTNAASKDALPWLKLATFGNERSKKGSLRHDKNVLAITGVEGDYDAEEMPFHNAATIIERARLNALAYTSPSHTPTKPRWRLLLPTSRPLPPDERTKLAARVNGLVGGKLAGESFTLSQGYFYGSVNGSPAHQAVIVDGDFIDLRDDLDATAMGKQKAAKTEHNPKANTERKGTNGKAGSGFEEILATMGNGPDLKGFHNPLRDAVWSYVATHGASFDRAALLSRLRAAIEAAPMAEPHPYLDGDDHLNALIDSALEKFADRRGGTNLPVVRCAAGELPRMVDEAEAALLAMATDLYRRAHHIVRPVWDEILTSAGKALSLRISQVQPAHLHERFTEAAYFEKYIRKEWVRVDCPDRVVDAYMARDGKWRLPTLLSVVTAPTLRHDGSVLDRPGYDEATGILFDPCGAVFPAVPKRPSREDALRALAVLQEPIKKYLFVGAQDRSVALSGMMTAVIRSALPVAPIHAYTAPTAGSGKSKIVDVASVLATGHEAATTSMGHDNHVGNSELEKRLGASYLAGDQIVTIDNIEAPLGGDFLCQMASQESVRLRVLGRSTNITVPNTVALFATGNNLVIEGDLTRRALVGRIDPMEERPELRQFDFDPVQYAKKDRSELVVAVLTIIRARLVSDAPARPPLGGYPDWSRLVRDSLIWLGEADPVATMEQARANDPKLDKLKTVIGAWRTAFAGEVTVADLIKASKKTLPPDRQDPDAGEAFRYPDLRSALLAVADPAGRGDVNSEKLSWYVRQNAGRPVRPDPDSPDTYRIVRAEGGKYARWLVEKIARQGLAGLEL